jgi:hypothetical protein
MGYIFSLYAMSPAGAATAAAARYNLYGCNRNCYYPCIGRLDITLVTHTFV